MKRETKTVRFVCTIVKFWISSIASIVHLDPVCLTIHLKTVNEKNEWYRRGAL